MDQIQQDPGLDLKTSFFRKLDWSAFWTAFVITFGVYFYTLAPTVTMEDSGELATAGAYLGIPHPPGYPIWSMTSWLFTEIFAFVTFRGQPNPAWAIGLASAFFGALASGLTALLVCRSGTDLLHELKKDDPAIGPGTQNLFCWVGAVASSLVFAFTSINWSQSVIVEVYALNAFFLALVMALAYRWFSRPTSNGMIVLSLIFGLGLTNYQALLLMLPALAVLIMVRDMSLFRDFAIAGVAYGIVVLLIELGKLPVIAHPLHYTGITYFILNIVAIVLIYIFLPHGRTVALSILGFELGLAVYGYMPIASETNPPMNWAYPRTWEGFQHAVTRGQYEKIMPTPIFSMDFVMQVKDYLSDLRAQFTLPIAIVGLLPFTAWSIKLGSRTFKILYVAVGLIFSATVMILAEELVVPSGIEAVSLVYMTLIAVVLFLVTMGITAYIVKEGERLFVKLSGRELAATSERILIGLVFFLALLIYAFCVYKLCGKFVEVIAPLSSKTLSALELRQGLGHATALVILMLFPAAMCYFVWLLMRRGTRMELTVDRETQRWIIVIMASFLVMSVLFIDLASPKGDIQDYFIQRVKYISSHALYAIWVGYGMIFGLAYAISAVHLLFKSSHINRLATVTGAILVMLTPLIPIGENAYNREQIRVVGGAEQNGHDFGWQFGNYQLRGAAAILEELDPTEEPLPNPSFPPEMGMNAVFYGGTDPGRFVPTYMIYSAKVREDVYLITQNALADNTYMGVMRDLYGDQIWIPSQVESGMAFQRYVEEVRAGKRPQNADLKIEGGRVQVSGALGVMEINGILAQMIFEHNGYKHPFYVEESYVIRWMYPYLVPHGLIMKIETTPAPLDEATIRNDMDFWDWYTRRLISNEEFLRDIVARKSFSKLRSAIAGLYASPSRNRFTEAEEAYQEARTLYSLSPEANFRLAQEVYLSHGQFDKAREVIAQFTKEDPGNKQARGFLGQIDAFKNTASRVTELEALIPQQKLTIDMAVELAGLYSQMGQVPKFMALANGILSNSNLPAQVQFQIASMYQRMGRNEEMVSTLDLFLQHVPPEMPPEGFIDITRMYLAAQRNDKAAATLQEYLKKRPTDWRAWLDSATLEISFNRTSEAIKALEYALRSGGNEALAAINQGTQFINIKDEAIRRSQSLMGIPESRLRPGAW